MAVRLGNVLVSSEDVDALLLHKAAEVEEFTSDDFIFECVQQFVGQTEEAPSEPQKKHLELLVGERILALAKKKKLRAIGKRRFRLVQSKNAPVPTDGPVQLQLGLAWSLFSVSDDQRFREGVVTEITQSVYERDANARRICLEHFGFDCCVCGFNFERAFGELGRAFIHVHHLEPLSQGVRETNPREDLRPVCPNCHAMLHRRRPPFTPEELRHHLKKSP